MARLMTKRSRYVTRLAAVAAAVVTLAACGSTTSNDVKGSDDASVTTVRWSAQTVTMTQATLFAAMGRHAFEKYHVDAKFVPVQSNPAGLTTGSTDIVVGRYSDAPLLVSQGKAVKVIGATAINTPFGLLGNNKVKSVADLAKMGAGCSIAAGSSGATAVMFKHWSEKYGLTCKQQVPTDYNVTIGGTVAGTYTASVQLGTNVGTTVQDGKAHWLLDPFDTTAANYVGEPPYTMINSIILTTPAFIEKNKAALTGFFDALKETQEWMKTASSQEIAQAIKDSGVAYWKPQTLDQIVAQLTGSGAAKNVFKAVGLGLFNISDKVWKENLTAPDQGLTIDANDAKYSYESMYDGEFVK